MARPTLPINLTPEQRDLLARLARSRETPHSLVVRTQRILSAAEGRPNKTIAGTLGVCEETVSFWRKRWLSSQDELAKGAGHPQRLREVVGRLLRIAHGRGVRGPLVPNRCAQSSR